MPSEPHINHLSRRIGRDAGDQFVETEGERRYTITVVHYMNASAVFWGRAEPGAKSTGGVGILND